MTSTLTRRIASSPLDGYMIKICAFLITIFFHSAVLAQTQKQDTFMVKGRVLNQLGQPVPNAQILAYPGNSLKGRLPSTSSDGKGEFAIEVHQTGPFALTASKQNDGYASTYNAFHFPSDELLTRIVVTENEPTSFADVRLGPKAGVLTGTVWDISVGLRRPVEKVQIEICRSQAPKYCYRSVTSGVNFSVLVPPVPLTIQISADGYQDWYGSDDGDPAIIQVDSGETKTIRPMLHKQPAQGEIILLEPPLQVSPVNGAELNIFPRLTRLQWLPVPGAASYTVELQACNMGDADGKECGFYQVRANPPLAGIETTSYEFMFLGMQPGRWRVWAVDEKGRSGAKSPWFKFVYLR